MKNRLLQIRVDEVFLSKLEYLRKINGYRTVAETVRKIVEKEYRKEKQNMPWIPCAEKMPHAEYGESDSVLCCTECGLQIVLYFDGGNWKYPDGDLYISVNHENGWHDYVVAWMPLPQPWKGEEDG